MAKINLIILSCLLWAATSTAAPWGSQEYREQKRIEEEERVNMALVNLLRKNRTWQIKAHRKISEIAAKDAGNDREKQLVAFANDALCNTYFGVVYPALTEVYRSSSFMTGLSEARIQDQFVRVYENKLDESDSIDDSNYALGRHILSRLKRETVASATLNANHKLISDGLAAFWDRNLPEEITCRDEIQTTLDRQREGGYDKHLKTAIEILQEAGYLSDQLAQDADREPFYLLDQFLHLTPAYLHYRESEAENAIVGVLMSFEDVYLWQQNMCEAYGALLATTDQREILQHPEQPECLSVAANQQDSGERKAGETLDLHKLLSEYTTRIRPNLTRVIGKHNWLKKEFELVEFGPTELGLASKARINPNDDLGRIAIKELYAETLAAAILWDTYQLSLRPIFQTFPFRIRDIPETYRSTTETLDRIEKNQEENVYTKRLLWGFTQLKDHYHILTENRFEDLKSRYDDYDAGESINYASIMGLTKAKDLFDDNKSLQNSGSLNKVWRSIRNKGLMVGLKTATKVSKTFGNTMGMINAGRDGYLLESVARDPVALAELKRNLRPLDILLEKSRFLATDKTIPGHYGHVALWMGNAEQLEAYGMTDSRLESLYVKAKLGYDYMADRPAEQQVTFKQSIEDGHGVLEALRSGVQLNKLEHFLNIDDLAVIRFNFCDDGLTENCITKEEIVTYLNEGFKQVGKSYDFAFDTETEREIVCSELIFRIFINHTWPTSASIGPMNAISPDQVAVKADWLDSNEGLSLKTEQAIPIMLYNYNAELGKLDPPIIDDDYKPGVPDQDILEAFRNLIHDDYKNSGDSISAGGA